MITFKLGLYKLVIMSRYTTLLSLDTVCQTVLDTRREARSTMIQNKIRYKRHSSVQQTPTNTQTLKQYH